MCLQYDDTDQDQQDVGVVLAVVVGKAGTAPSVICELRPSITKAQGGTMWRVMACHPVMTDQSKGSGTASHWRSL